MTGEPRVHHEPVLVDQTELGQSQRELQAADEQSVAGLLLQLPNRRAEIAAHEGDRSNRPT